MTTFNTDYNNTELLDQELTTAELSQVSGGLTPQEFEAELRKVDGPLPYESGGMRYHTIEVEGDPSWASW